MSTSRPTRCLITAGPTREFIDPVRFISNPSSGKMGYALAQAAHNRGWEVTLISGPVQIKAPEGPSCVHVISGQEMHDACHQHFQNCDVLIMTAAVTDMRSKKTFSQKQKKKDISWTLEFEQVVDILKSLSIKKKNQLIVGFAAETQNLEEYALRKLEEKDLDYIVANDVSEKGAGFESDHNHVHIYGKTEDAVQLGPSPKIKIAEGILDHIAKSVT